MHICASTEAPTAGHLTVLYSLATIPAAGHLPGLYSLTISPLAGRLTVLYIHSFRYSLHWMQYRQNTHDHFR